MVFQELAVSIQFNRRQGKAESVDPLFTINAATSSSETTLRQLIEHIIWTLTQKQEQGNSAAKQISRRFFMTQSEVYLNLTNQQDSNKTTSPISTTVFLSQIAKRLEREGKPNLNEDLPILCLSLVLNSQQYKLITSPDEVKGSDGLGQNTEGNDNATSTRQMKIGHKNKNPSDFMNQQAGKSGEEEFQGNSSNGKHISEGKLVISSRISTSNKLEPINLSEIKDGGKVVISSKPMEGENIHEKLQAPHGKTSISQQPAGGDCCWLI